MSAWIFTVAQQKGGAGKTTLAAHLAVTWARQGQRVSVIDIDPQASLGSWAGLRARAVEDDPLQIHSVTGWRVTTRITRAAEESDIVIIDSPPHAEAEARMAVRAAHLVVIPMQPSPMDLWATEATLTLAREEKRDALLVLNRIPSRTRIADDMSRHVAALEVAVAAASLGNRTGFAAALAEGQGIEEVAPHSIAAREIRALAAELEARVQSTTTPPTDETPRPAEPKQSKKSAKPKQSKKKKRKRRGVDKNA